MTQFLQATQGRADPIVKYCCVLQTDLEGTVVNGDGFIVEFQGLQEAELLALNWRNRRKTGGLQTDYALITSHDTMPGLSPSALKDWTFSCQGIESGKTKKQQLSNFVCGVISCCGSETLFAGHSPDAKVFVAHHGNANCDIQLNIAILFLNKSFEELLQRSTGKVRTLLPPVVPVGTYLDQTLEYEQIITRGELDVYSCNARMRTVKTTLAKQQDTSGQNTASVLNKEIVEFERLQKLETCSTIEIGHGSPVVYLNPETKEASIIGVYVGETKQKGRYIVVTIHGILRLLQGGLVPVLSALQCLDIPHAWVSRWGYLVTPHIDQLKKMESDYACEVLHFLLRERHGTPLVKLPVDLVDKDNEASLVLLCALFKHFESADNADLNEAVTKLNLENEMNTYITRLCKNVVHLLELCALMATDRPSLVEKCCIFYNLLLDFKFAEITEQILCTSQNVELLKNITKRYKHSDVVQENVIGIILKSLDRHPLRVEELLTLVDQILPQDVVDSLKESASGNVQTTLEEVQQLFHREKIVSSLRQLLNSGYPLSSKEVQDLIVQILPQDVIGSLEKSGLDLKTSGNIQTTLKEVRRLLHQHENVSSLRQFLDSALENQSHYDAYQQALKEGVPIPLKYLKVLFFGPPRTGKTSMRRRLVGEILNLANEPIQASTGTAEHYDVIVKVVEDKTTKSPAFITKSEWSNVKTLFGKEKNVHETDLDEELQFLYQFIYASPVVSQTENKNSTSPINRSESSDSRSPEEEAQNEVTKQGSANMKTDIVPSPVPSKAGSNATTQNVSLVREHDQQMPEIETAFKAFDKVLHRAAGRQEILNELLDGTIFMNMVDTGGHPAFLEMLPALTMGPALYLIFFRLDQELKKSYKIQYVSEDKESVQVGESSYTVEEVIFQALSSIACFSCTEPIKNMPNSSHAAMLMCTYEDQLGSNPENLKNEIKSKDAALQTSLREVLETDPFEAGKIFLHYASDDHNQLMFTIDNMTGDDKKLKEVRERLEKIIKQEFDNHSIPASWLMFNIFLRKMGKRTLSLSQCHEIGGGLGLEVRDTNGALWFLHHCVGTLMHFPDVEGIKDVVICDPQVVFDSVTDLILNSFDLKQVSGPIRDHFEKTGQFSFKQIQKIARNNSSDNLPLLKLVKLLEHLNIIAPIRTECHSSSPQSDKVFFMPAVLKHATEEELHVEQSDTDPVPLMIRFKCGFVPVGVFCAKIVSLVAQKGTLGWILQKPKDGHDLFKNKVTFRINGAFNITLISKPKWYEVHIARISTTDRALEEICQHVVETVCNILDQVITKMKYKRLFSSSDQTLYELGFKCPKHPDDDHLVINRPKGGVKFQPSQSTKSLWLNYLAIERESTMICPKETISIDLRDTCLPKCFAQQSLVWFGEATEISSASPDWLCAGIQSHAKELNVMEIVNVLHDANFADGDWEQLGQQLMDHSSLTTIRANRHGDSSPCMIDTIAQWLRTDAAKSWEKLAKAVAKVGGYGEATADIVRQKGGIVHTAAETIQSPQEGVSSQLPLTSKVDTHEYLRGFEVFAETSFIVPDSHSHSFEWQRYGLKLHIPEGAVPVEHSGCRVDFKAGFTGQFNIPDDVHLVSCVYWLSCSQTFVEPVTLEIEHCASLQDSSQSSSLSFIVAKCSQAELLYQFEVLEGGKFAPSSSYGSIQVSQFSFFAIIFSKIFPSPQRYCCTHHYIQKGYNKWDVDFVIIPHLQASLTVIKENYSNATSGAGFEVQFEDEAISLEIPDDGVCLPNGWTIRPLVSPRITKQQVTMFKPGQLIPCCQLRVKLDNSENPVELEHKVNLLGTKGPHQFFTITCSPQEYVVEKPGGVTGGKRKQLEKKQHDSPTVAYVEKPVTASTKKRKQTGGEERASYMRWHMSLPPLWILVLLLAVVIGAGLWLSGPNSSHLYHSLSPSGSSTISPSTDCHQIARKQDLNTELAKIGDWRSLCTNLEVPEAVINNLENEPLNNNAKKQNCLSAYFDQGNACWKKVIEVVADHPFHNKRLAKQIAKKFGVTWQE